MIEIRVADTEETADEDGEAPKKKGLLMPLVIGLVLAIAGGAGGFFVMSSGMLGGEEPEVTEAEAEPKRIPPIEDIAFVPLDPLTIDLGKSEVGQLLRFRAEVEVFAEYKADVEVLAPRLIDVMNSYLRAIDPKELEDPAALLRLRIQLLRRMQLVAGDGRVRDLLIMEFVLN